MRAAARRCQCRAVLWRQDAEKAPMREAPSEWFNQVHLAKTEVQVRPRVHCTRATGMLREQIQAARLKFLRTWRYVGVC